MKVIKGGRELPAAIRDAEHGSVIRVATSTVKKLGECTARRMKRGDLRFVVASGGDEAPAADRASSFRPWDPTSFPFGSGTGMGW